MILLKINPLHITFCLYLHQLEIQMLVVLLAPSSSAFSCSQVISLFFFAFVCPKRSFLHLANGPAFQIIISLQFFYSQRVTLSGGTGNKK